ncbi:hypothetical protein BLOT_007899 [Blomia tropicalis]|nr:hypothetical protein BLOT_007899 [Blomia tropicalis]
MIGTDESDNRLVLEPCHFDIDNAQSTQPASDQTFKGQVQSMGRVVVIPCFNRNCSIVERLATLTANTALQQDLSSV